MSVERGHALIIEDDELTALALKTLLTDMGYSSFDVAESPRRALWRAIFRRPALITADVQIDAGTGMEAIALIAAWLGPIAAIYITGSAELVPPADPWPRVRKPFSASAIAIAADSARATVAAEARRTEPGLASRANP